MTRNTIPLGVRSEVMARDRHCQAHARGFALDLPCAGYLVVHHVIIKGMGGTSIPELNNAANLLVLCDRHHVHAHERDRAGAEASGIIVRRGARAS